MGRRGERVRTEKGRLEGEPGESGGWCTKAWSPGAPRGLLLCWGGGGSGAGDGETELSLPLVHSWVTALRINMV